MPPQELSPSAALLFLGGDARTEYAATALTGKGFHTERVFSLSALTPLLLCGRAIVLPQPLRLSPASVEETLDFLFTRCTETPPLILTPAVTPQQRKTAAALSLTLRCYGDDETFLREGAVLTAKGMLLALKERLHLPFKKGNLGGWNLLLAGYGRVGKACAAALREEGVTVTVLCRREEARAQARKDGFAAAPLLPPAKELTRRADLLCSTVPVPLFGKDALSEFRGLYVELASGEGALLPGALPAHRILRLPGLPGRYFPREAGLSLAAALERTLAAEAAVPLRKGGEGGC